MGKLASTAALLFIGSSALILALIRVWGDWPHPGSPMRDALRRLETPDELGRDAPVIAFLFSSSDCSAALRVGRLWSQLHRSGRIRVRGVLVDGPRDGEQIARLLGSEGIAFPVSRAEGQRLAAALAGLGFDTTPVTILADHRRRPRLIAPATLDSLEQAAFAQLVLAQIDQLSRPAAGVR